MSKIHNNRWKIHRRNPSSTAGARHALAIAYSVVSMEVTVTDDGRIFTARIRQGCSSSQTAAHTLPLLAIRINGIFAGWQAARRSREKEAIDRVGGVLEQVSLTNIRLAQENARLSELLHRNNDKLTD